jgi:hypothetical protein
MARRLRHGYKDQDGDYVFHPGSLPHGRCGARHVVEGRKQGVPPAAVRSALHRMIWSARGASARRRCQRACNRSPESVRACVKYEYPLWSSDRHVRTLDAVVEQVHLVQHCRCDAGQRRLTWAAGPGVSQLAHQMQCRILVASGWDQVVEARRPHQRPLHVPTRHPCIPPRPTSGDYRPRSDPACHGAAMTRSAHRRSLCP